MIGIKSIKSEEAMKKVCDKVTKVIKEQKEYFNDLKKIKIRNLSLFF
jgi:hypothetical protein